MMGEVDTSDASQVGYCSTRKGLETLSSFDWNLWHQLISAVQKAEDKNDQVWVPMQTKTTFKIPQNWSKTHQLVFVHLEHTAAVASK